MAHTAAAAQPVGGGIVFEWAVRVAVAKYIPAHGYDCFVRNVALRPRRGGRLSSMTQEDIVIAIAAGADGPYGLDPVRLMKGVFLASKKGLDEWDDLFAFRPYSYGPFDQTVYGIRDRLVAARLLEVDHTGPYERYALTTEGRSRDREIQDEVGSQVSDWLHRIGAYVSAKPFAALLREVYAEYPEYAKRSVFTR